jgi:hypothetical protein
MVMGVDFTFANAVAAGMAIVETAPPQPFAISCPPGPDAVAHTDNVYVRSGIVVICHCSLTCGGGSTLRDRVVYLRPFDAEWFMHQGKYGCFEVMEILLSD